MIEARTIARQALAGVGDPSLGEWIETSPAGIVHVRRRLSEAEQAASGIACARDIRGTLEERERVLLLVADAPYLAGMFR